MGYTVAVLIAIAKVLVAMGTALIGGQSVILCGFGIALGHTPSVVVAACQPDLGGNIALIGCLAEIFCCLEIILGHTVTEIAAKTQIELGRGISLIGGQPVIFHRFGQISLHTPTVLVAVAKTVLGSSISHLSGLTEMVGCKVVVLVSVVVDAALIAQSNSIVLLNGRGRLLRNGGGRHLNLRSRWFLYLRNRNGFSLWHRRFFCRCDGFLFYDGRLEFRKRKLLQGQTMTALGAQKDPILQMETELVLSALGTVEQFFVFQLAKLLALTDGFGKLDGHRQCGVVLQIAAAVKATAGT